MEKNHKVLSENLNYITKNSFELINKLSNINNIIEIHVFDFKDLCNCINLSVLKFTVTDSLWNLIIRI